VIGLSVTTAMHKRKLQAFVACVVLLIAAELYGLVCAVTIERWRIAVWGALGVGIHILLARLVGFDPQRGGDPFASPLLQYFERWELRSGQATLGMVACVSGAALLADADHFLVALICATLAAWIYFTIRLATGGYHGISLPRVRTRAGASRKG